MLLYVSGCPKLVEGALCHPEMNTLVTLHSGRKERKITFNNDVYFIFTSKNSDSMQKFKINIS
jgi:hypothetical protein